MMVEILNDADVTKIQHGDSKQVVTATALGSMRTAFTKIAAGVNMVKQQRVAVCMRE